MKTFYKTIIAILFVCFTTRVSAQINPYYWNKAGSIGVYGGLTYPNTSFSSKTSTGLYANDQAFQFGVEGNYIFKYGLGLGLDMGGEWFKFDKQAFLEYANPETYKIEGNYTLTYFGLNLVGNIPVRIDKKHFTINLFAVGTAGLRGIRIPDIDLTYDEILNKYVEVNYQPRANTGGYLAYRGGIQFLFNNAFGLSLSYKSVVPNQQRLNYSVRMFDATGELYEEENYLSTHFSSESYQVGVVFLLGVN